MRSGGLHPFMRRCARPVNTLLLGLVCALAGIEAAVARPLPRASGHRSSEASVAGDTWRRRSVLMRRPLARGTRFLGDYEALAACAKWVIAAFVVPTRPSALRQVVEVERLPTGA